MNSTSTESEDKPSIYIDTCIARDVTEHRSDASVDLIARIKREVWTCRMSIFGLMELVDVEQESMFINLRYFIEKQTLDEVYSSRRTRDLGQKELEKSFKYIEKFLNDHSFVELVGLDDDGWSLAIFVASHSNLHASDGIHLASAWQNDCDLVVTNDTSFIKEAKRYLKEEGIWDALKVCEAKDCYSALEKMGYANIK